MKRLTRPSASSPSSAAGRRPSALVLLSDQQSTRRAIAWVIGHLGPGQKPLIWAPEVRSLRLDGELEAFSKYAALRTPQSWAAWHGGPVLALWPESRDLAELGRDRRVTALCVLGRPADRRHNGAWVAATGAAILTAEGVLPAPARELHPVVVEALRALTTLVDHDHRLTGPADLRHAVVTLTTLRHGGYRIDPDGICGWALAHGWPEDSATRLRELAAKIQAGVEIRARGLDSYPRPELLRRWRDGAAAAAS